VYRALDDGSGNPETSPDLTVALAQALPAAAVTGSAARTRLRITNAGQTAVAGAADLGLYLSGDAYLHPDDTLVATLPRKLRLRPGASKTIRLPFTFPQSIAAGNYHLLAWADAAKAVVERNEGNNVAASAGQVALAEAQRDFSVSVTGVAPTPGLVRRGMVTLLLRYDGNVRSGGPLGIELRASSDTTPDDADTLLLRTARRVRMRPGQTKLIRLRVVPTGIAAGAYYVTAAVDTAAAFAETSETNNTATSATTFTV
jgi:subtilase family serine protease